MSSHTSPAMHHSLPQAVPLPIRANPTISVPANSAPTASSASVLSSSPKLMRGTSVRLSVPLDGKQQSLPPARQLLRRDSLDRREALLKGKEGSRQRRRWENDRLLSNPHAEPPLPQDWEIRPTYPVRRVPYYLAPLWDAAEFQRAIESHSKGRRNTRTSRKRRGVSVPGVSPFEEDAMEVAREVRGRLKHARSAKGLLMDLEEDVRGWLGAWGEKECKARSEIAEQGRRELPVRTKPESKHASTDSAVISDTEGEEDEEIVFVGRGGGSAQNGDDVPNRPPSSDSKYRNYELENLLTEKLVFEGLEEDKGAAFGRWLAHCIGSYYGLRTWSVTTTPADATMTDDCGISRAAKQVGNGRVRQAYVGVDARIRGWMGSGWENGRDFELPRPLWGMV